MQSEVILQNRTMEKLFSPHGMQTGRLFFESSTILLLLLRRGSDKRSLAPNPQS
jgi:hypothetical protein